MPSKRPNILFVLTDDQRFDTIHALGNSRIVTPNMDALVESGTSFTHACIMGGTNPAVCMPSRAMLMTGRHLFRLQGQGAVIPPDHTTLPEVLRREGYWTHHIGKWHQDRESFNRSFVSADRIFGFTQNWYVKYGGHWNVAVHDYDPTGQYTQETGYILAEDKTTRLPIGVGVGGVHSSEMFADAAVAFLDHRGEEKKRGDKRPFFLYLSFVAPHDPRQSPNEFEEMYSPESVELPPNFLPRHPFDNGEFTIRDEELEAWPRRPRAIRRHLAEYYAMISHADAQMGRVIRRLKELGEYDNTLIVFTGDNGLAVGQHGLMGKQNLYDHSLRVPLIFSGPGIRKKARVDGLCYLLDIFPTLCDCTGIPIPASVDGTSLRGMLDGSVAGIRETQFHGYRHVQRAVRGERWKLIEYAVGGKRTTQLFDVQADPFERVNLAADPAHAATVGRMRAELLRWRTVSGDTRPEEAVFWDGFNNG
ncbi:MAG: sulfatase-like hydrolase/transferase [Lentisphaerae bacterium]|nr:sulfatase-like hydrolase/transferase [Lentisphaerota bacterium]